MQKRDSDGETLLILIVDLMKKAMFWLKGKENVRLGGRKKWILIAGNLVLENKHISTFIRDVGENVK